MSSTDARHLPDSRPQAGDRHLNFHPPTGQPPRSFSPSTSFRTICSGVCRPRFIVCCPPSPHRGPRTRTTGGSAYGDPVERFVQQAHARGTLMAVRGDFPWLPTGRMPWPPSMTPPVSHTVRAVLCNRLCPWRFWAQKPCGGFGRARSTCFLRRDLCARGHRERGPLAGRGGSQACGGSQADRSTRQFVPEILRGLALDMAECVAEVARVLEEGGGAAFVVGNPSYEGYEYEADLIVAEAMEEAGSKMSGCSWRASAGRAPSNRRATGSFSGGSRWSSGANPEGSESRSERLADGSPAPPQRQDTARYRQQPLATPSNTPSDQHTWCVLRGPQERPLHRSTPRLTWGCTVPAAGIEPATKGL